jgi:hypothetical protein
LDSNLQDLLGPLKLIEKILMSSPFRQHLKAALEQHGPRQKVQHVLLALKLEQLQRILKMFYGKYFEDLAFRSTVTSSSSLIPWREQMEESSAIRKSKWDWENSSRVLTVIAEVRLMK